MFVSCAVCCVKKKKTGLLCQTMSYDLRSSSGPEKIKLSHEKLPWHYKKPPLRQILDCTAWLQNTLQYLQYLFILLIFLNIS